ncbi:MAG: TetR family transcriptional regulator [Chloroflexota bacterium]|nr:TetR family transcriptional regulator [Chloroflexota bacterium]
MRRTKEEAAITREHLLNAALVSFRAKGYLATTLDDIARQAGTTRGAIHWHFGNKAELFNTLIRERYQQATMKFREVYTMGGTPLHILRQILIKWMSYTEEDADFRTMLELLMWKTEPAPELASGMQEKVQGTRVSVQHFTELIQRGIEAGEIRPEVQPEVAAITALGMINGITTMWILDPAAFSLKARTEQMVDLFIRGIAQPQA